MHDVFVVGIRDGLVAYAAQAVEVVVPEGFGFASGVVFAAKQVAFLHIEVIAEVLYAACRSAGGHPKGGVTVGALHGTGGGFGGLPQGVLFRQFPDAGGSPPDLRIVPVGIHKVLRADGSFLGLVLYGRDVAVGIGVGLFQPFAVGGVFVYRSEAVVRVVRKYRRCFVGGCFVGKQSVGIVRVSCIELRSVYVGHPAKFVGIGDDGFARGIGNGSG